MKTVCRRLAKVGVALAAGALLWGAAAGPAAAAQTVTIDARDLLIRMQRMERDIRDLQAETFRRPPGAAAAAQAAAVPVAPAIPDLDPIMRRMDELGASLTRLTGQVEELGHQMGQLSDKADRLQKEMDYQAQVYTQMQAQMQAGTAPAEGAPAAPGGAVASLAPGQPAPRSIEPAPGVLGQIPADAPLPLPGGATELPQPPAAEAGPKEEFDSAMNLLSRAQYVPAGEAFRAFADAHPEDERASQALYWAGDIAYSAKKDYEEAAREFAELLKKYPMSARAPESMLKLGLSLFELGQMREGCAALAALPAKYPAASPTIATRARNERRDNNCR